MQREDPDVFRSTSLNHRTMYGKTAGLELTPGNSFQIDDLLNFSNEEIAGPIGENDLPNNRENDGSANFDFVVYGNSFSKTDYHSSSDCFLPFDEEWPEDSFSMENSKYMTPLASQSLEDGKKAINLEGSISPSGGCESLNEAKILSICVIPVRARSKRSRPARKVSNWHSLHSSTRLLEKKLHADVGSASCKLRDVRKKLQVSNISNTSSSNLREEAEISNMMTWRCMHCGTERTPLWREGPMGRKTLCNACGVRYKSGRLLPEYRPAASPSFSPSIHSNSHKNVLHLRRLKQIAPRS